MPAKNNLTTLGLMQHLRVPESPYFLDQFHREIQKILSDKWYMAQGWTDH